MTPRRYIVAISVAIGVSTAAVLFVLTDMPVESATIGVLAGAQAIGVLMAQT